MNLITWLLRFYKIIYLQHTIYSFMNLLYKIKYT